MVQELLLYTLSVIDFPHHYKTIHCKSTNKNSICIKWYHTYHNSLESFNQFIYKFTTNFTDVLFLYKVCHVGTT